MLFMVYATFFFSFMQVLVKYVDLPISQIILMRAGVSFVLCALTIYFKKEPFLGNNKPWLVARGVFGVASLSCFFYAIHHAPLGSVVTIVNIKPFLVLFIASVFLKEKVLKRQWLFFAVSFIGIIVIKGVDHDIEAKAFWAILGAACFAGCAHTIVRKLKETDKAEVILLYFTFITIPAVLPFAIYYWETPTTMEWLALFAIGFITHMGQLFLTKAYQVDNVASVSNIYYLGIAFAIFFGIVLFDEVYSTKVWAGICLVLLGIMLNVLYGKKKAAVEK